MYRGAAQTRPEAAPRTGRRDNATRGNTLPATRMRHELAAATRKTFPVDALLIALLLLSTLLVSAFLITTGASRFTSGRASGFTTFGAPHVRFPWSAGLGLGELLVGVALVTLPSPASMLAAYVALMAILAYAVTAARSYRPRDQRRPGDVTGPGLGAVIALCGVAVLAIADSLALQSALVRLFDPATFGWLSVIAPSVVAVRWLLRRPSAPSATPGAGVRLKEAAAAH